MDSPRRTLTSREASLVGQALREKATHDRRSRTELLQELEAVPRGEGLTAAYQGFAAVFEEEARNAELLAEAFDLADVVELVPEVSGG